MSETCDRHDDCLGRIHTEINAIKEGNASMSGKVESFMQHLDLYMKKTDKDIYDPQNGLGARVNSHATQLGLQWGVITTIIGSIIVGVIVGVVISWLKK